MALEGGCYCGGVRYVAEGDPMMKAECLCRECHDGTHGSAGPVGRNAAGIQGGLTKSTGPSATEVGRGCTNCHVQVHGSNSPAGGFLQR